MQPYEYISDPFITDLALTKLLFILVHLSDTKVTQK